MIRQYHFPLPRKDSKGIEDFLPSAANDAAVAWLLRRVPAQWPSHALVLWGPEGSGKTHMLSIWAEKMDAVFVTPEDERILIALGKNARGISSSAPFAFVLDEADALAGHSSAEEWLFHFFNATRDARAPLLMASRSPPSLWGLTLQDIETRLKSCQSVEILPPDDDLMRGLLLKLFADRQLMVDIELVEYLAARLDRTGKAVIEAVDLLDEAALETGRKISVPFAQKILNRTVH